MILEKSLNPIITAEAGFFHAPLLNLENRLKATNGRNYETLVINSQSGH